MAHIHVLDDNGFVTSTKFYDEVNPDMIGNVVTTFYDEKRVLYGYYEVNNDYAVVSGQVVSFEQGYENIVRFYSRLLNLIASLEGEELIDLRLQRRDEPSYLRFCESILLKENIDFTFNKVETSIDEIIKTLNELRFNLDVFLFPVTIDDNNGRTSRYNFCHSISKTTLAIQYLVQYENVEFNESDFEDEEAGSYQLVNKMMSLFNSVHASCLHIPSHDYYGKDENYFKS
jgi:hypothetical protein